MKTSELRPPIRNSDQWQLRTPCISCASTEQGQTTVSGCQGPGHSCWYGVTPQSAGFEAPSCTNQERVLRSV
ncbi:hypothetical protein PAXRUDRAFT_187370 [Paxillus rubicundulus Ve08.2h10]|uniref:Uncharacterized protein n=1 Tax=Paxillus rubicundulus Ve08.2h10 TaxID=930991 RepID=A0A0D0EDF6_9AGAM|nr:hypothetical protein PAXRUDRAFT_187370 [Paxillus rubicundulus Ve08.2h10]